MALPITRTSREAHARSAISRAYYAAYQTALYEFVTRGHYQRPAPGMAGLHVDLITYIGLDPTRQHQSAASRLNTLRKMRTRADYDAFVPPDLVQNIEHHLRNARRLIADLRRLPAW
jgi:hypothetical protein